MASRHEIREVRAVLYDRERMRSLRAHLSSIDVLMNLDPTRALPPDDTRIQGGAGPDWVYPATGAINGAVLEAADRCDKIAALLLKTRRKLDDVSFDRSDKKHLRDGLEELARSWRRRADAWRAPGRPGVEQAVGVITAHFAAAVRELRKVDKYLKESERP